MKYFLKFLFIFLVTFTVINNIYTIRVSAEISEETLNAVVRIYCELLGEDGQVVGYSTGSGFAVGIDGEDPEYFVTNAHVVTNQWNGNIGDIYILLDDDSARFTKQSVMYIDSISEEIIGTDDILVDFELDTSINKAIKCDIEYVSDYGEPDIAIVHSDKKVKDRHPGFLLSVDKMAKGDSVRALGFPAIGDEIATKSVSDGYEYIKSEGDIDIYVKTYDGYFFASTDQATLTDGTINRFTVYGDMECNVIETSAQIGEGNSGGPLITDDGAIIGITSWGTHDESSNRGAYYAVYIDYVMELLDDYGIKYERFDQKSGDLNRGKFPIITLISIITMCLMVLIAIIVFMLTERGHSKRKKGRSVDEVKLVCCGGSLNGREKLIGEKLLVIGRSIECDIKYPSETVGVSRKHCSICINKKGIILQDLGSKAGTIIVGRGKLVANQPYVVEVGDKFYLGDSTNLFEIKKTR